MTESKKTTYTAGLVLPEFPGEAIENGAVVVEGEKIVWVGPASEVPAGSGEVVDLGGATLMPGIIDTHVHLEFDGSVDPVQAFEDADAIGRFSIMAQSARQMLSGGITTARDLGASDLLDVKIKEEIALGRIRGPRILSVNAPITVTGGHCYFLGGEAETPEGVRKAVRKARRDGADHIKIMATGGNMTPGTLPFKAQFGQDELDVIVETAHHYGMKVAAHAHGTEGIHRAILAGVDSIEHFSFAGPGDNPEYDEEVLQLAGERGVYASKTFSAGVGYFVKVLGVGGNTPLGIARKTKDLGVKLVLGTDSGINNSPHVEIVYGLEGLAAYGLTNEEVLIASTSLAAESLGLDEVTGRLRPGLAADMIVVPGNPLENLSTIRDLSLVIARGEEYVPEFRSTRSWNAEYDEPKYIPASAGGR